MPRFFVAGLSAAVGTVVIGGADAEHLQVLRLQPGSPITLSDGAGQDYQGRLKSLRKGEAEVELLSAAPCKAEPSLKLVVLAGMPKGERADLILQKCTELGASELCFFLSERCVCRPDAKGFEKKRERWQRIAEAAAKQSGRGLIPRVSILPDLGAALDCAVKAELPLFFFEEGPERVPFHDALSGKSPASVSVVTGPEGGFAPFEVELARRVGMTVCSLGPRILRCETAPAAILSAVLFATKNFG